MGGKQLQVYLSGDSHARKHASRYRTMYFRSIIQLVRFISALLNYVVVNDALAKQKRSDFLSFDRGMQVTQSDHIFSTPSLNINCTFLNNDGNLYCERKSPAYVAIVLKPESGAEILDAGIGDAGGDTMIDPVLPYNTWWSNGTFACLSEKPGLTCKNKAGYGFYLNGTTVTVTGIEQ